jgi:hypothetical protein
MSLMLSIDKPEAFGDLYYELAAQLVEAPIFDRGEVHAQKLVSPLQRTRELAHILLEMPIPTQSGVDDGSRVAEMVQGNTDWAEEQFWERVGGVPLNPPPSHERWPYAVKNNDIHRKDEKFSHTYPERFWPKWAGEEYAEMAESKSLAWEPRQGIRFDYGDLDNVIETLRKNHRTRQAYLPIWFPEDTYAASIGERVPCTLGYHFLMTERGLDITYPIRSCDFVRHFRDDVYMAMRLCQFVAFRMLDDPYSSVTPGKLIMNIGSLHIYDGDAKKLEVDIKDYWKRGGRHDYSDDFGAPV